MEVNVNVTIEVGPKTIAALTGGLVAGNATVASAPAKQASKPMAVVKDEAVAEETEAKASPAPKAASPAPKAAAAPKAASPAPAAKAVAAKPASAAPKSFGDMTEEDQLENLKAHVTKHTKKGKSADIKALLSNFGAGRASELTPDQYADFNDAISRYSAGESVEDIFPSLD